MKKIYLLLGLIGLSASVASAQEVVREPHIEMNQARSLWFTSNNAAGMGVMPLDKYSIVGFNYNMEKGDFKLTQDGEKETLAGFNTNGATSVGKTQLWGTFDYRNIVEKDASFITNLYDPHRDMPYYVADAVMSKFKKQSYDLGVKAAFPQLWGFVTPGMDLQYTTQTGAKQRDPRSVTYYLTVKANPSLLFELGERSNLGLTFNYEYLYERSTFNRSDTEVDCPVFIMRGLGNYTSDFVSGSVGVGTFFYKGNRIGGGLQYGFKNGGLATLVDVAYSYKVEDAFQNPTKKQAIGSTRQNRWNSSLQVLSENVNYMNKLTLSYVDRKTDGIEYIQELDSSFEVAEWITLAKYVRSKYSFRNLSVKYDIFAKRGESYSWRAGVEGNHSFKDDEYLLPASNLKAENTLWKVYAKKNFAAGEKSNIVAGLNIGFNKNKKGEYNYTGAYETSETVTNMYKNDILFMSSDYWNFGAEASYSTVVSQATSLFVKGEFQYWSPKDSNFDKRIYTGVSVGITF